MPYICSNSLTNVMQYGVIAVRLQAHLHKLSSIPSSHVLGLWQAIAYLLCRCSVHYIRKAKLLDYDHFCRAHIGHARVYISFDVLYRYLQHLGYNVLYVRNFTGDLRTPVDILCQWHCHFAKASCSVPLST